MKRNKFNIIHAISILLILTLLGQYGCKNESDLIGYKVTQDNSKKTPKHKIIYIDNCEYILMGTTNSGYMSHKGNCNNPIHNISSKIEPIEITI